MYQHVTKPTPISSMSSENFTNYFRSQQVSLQWLPVLRAMASELSEQIDPEDLRLLFARIGERFAKDVEDRFDDVQTIAQLEENLNGFWAQVNWGWVSLTEAKGFVEIEHQAAPLAEAFGDDALGWSIGLLEGFYQNVFGQLGAGESMRVKGLDEISSAMSIHLRFGQYKS